MSTKQSTPFYKEWYIWICVTSVFVGVCVVGMDMVRVRAKKHALDIKNEADKFFAAGELKKAVVLFAEVKELTRGDPDPDLRAATDLAVRDMGRAKEAIETQERLRIAKIREDEARRVILVWFQDVWSKGMPLLKTRVAPALHQPSYYAFQAFSSYMGELCGVPLVNGRSCRNRVKEGETRCHLHSVGSSHAYSSGTYVGPRGGVYHYSKSGKKVYNKR